MSKALVVGGSSGIGLAVVFDLLERGYEFINIVGKEDTRPEDIPEQYARLYRERTAFTQVNLSQEDYTVFDGIGDFDTLFISAGFGRVAPFEDLTETEISNLIKCNELSVIQILHRYYEKLQADAPFYCGVMVSIAGHVASPLFSVYGASKMGIRGIIENLNSELAATGSTNRILDISPGSLKGTRFNGGANNLSTLQDTAHEMTERMFQRELLYIPDYEKVYKGVIDRYDRDYLQYGKESYQYKMDGGRLSTTPQVTIGYLSGTFDLFHVGHINLLRKAKAECDYLIVGVHKNGSWKGKETFIPLEERMQVVASCRYVDKVILSYPEDCDAWKDYHYHKLFVGSDYKGSERFRRYEEYFSDKNVEIVYFPYTKGVSSTMLRQTLSNG